MTGMNSSVRSCPHLDKSHRNVIDLPALANRIRPGGADQVSSHKDHECQNQDQQDAEEEFVWPEIKLRQLEEAKDQDHQSRAEAQPLRPAGRGILGYQTPPQPASYALAVFPRCRSGRAAGGLL